MVDLGPLSKFYEYTVDHDIQGRIKHQTIYGTRYELGAAWLVIYSGDSDDVVAFPRERVVSFSRTLYLPPLPKEPEDQVPVLSLPYQDVKVESVSQSRLTGYNTTTVRHLPTDTLGMGVSRADAFRDLHTRLFALGYDQWGNPPVVEPEDEEPELNEPTSQAFKRLRGIVTRGGVDGA